MKVFSKSRVATCVLTAIPVMAVAKDTGKLENSVLRRLALK